MRSDTHPITPQLRPPLLPKRLFLFEHVRSPSEWLIERRVPESTVRKSGPKPSMSIAAGHVRPQIKENVMKLNKTLWTIQGVLAALFVFAGVMKLVMPIEAMAGPVALPEALLRLVGVA